MNTVEIYGFAASTYVRTARLVCEEKGIPYELKPLEFRQDSHRQLHPFLKMPTLRHGKISLFETLAIAEYLNEEFPGPDLEAGHGAERARMFQWISVANDYLYRGLVQPLAGAESIEPEAVATAASLLEPVDNALAKHPFLAGDALTLADLFVLPIVRFADQATGGATLLASKPDLARWHTSLSARPSMSKTEV